MFRRLFPSVVLAAVALAAAVAQSSIAQARAIPGPKPPSAPVRSWMSLREVSETTPLLYASTFATVNIYAPFGKAILPVGQLGADSGVNTPTGLGTDVEGNVWVANAGGSNGATNTVLEFARGGTKPLLTLHQKYGVEPEAVVVGKDGTVYVSDFEFSGIYYINEFAKNATKPFLTIGPLYEVGGIAIDGASNLYASYVDASGLTAHVAKFAPHHATGVDLGITFSGYPGGVALTQSNDLLLVDVFGRAIYTFPPGKTTSTHTIVEPGLEPFPLAIGPDGYNIFVAAGGGFCCGPSDIFEINYATGHVVQNITAGFPSSYPANGLTLTPRAPL